MACGTAVLTTHRLAYVDDVRPQRSSCAIALDCIKQSEHYAGFLKSSPKIALLLASAPAVEETWTCGVCGYRSSGETCAMCGVRRSVAGSVPVGAPPPPTPVDHACPACTFVNHPSMLRCEMCDTPLGRAKLRAAPTLRTVRLSFREGGARTFYTQLRATLQERPWAAAAPPPKDKPAPATPAAPAAPAGIHGVVTSVQQATRGRSDDVSDALADLEALMGRAKTMVEYAETLSTKLERASAGNAPRDASTLIQSSLVRLGLPTPAVTPDMVRDEDAYHLELARELAGVLLGVGPHPGLLARGKVLDAPGPLPPVSDDGPGLLPLDEAWGTWNRVRGVTLVSPRVFRAAAERLPEVTHPRVALRTLRSGRTVLHTPRFEDDVFEVRLLGRLMRAEGTDGSIDDAAPRLSAPGAGLSTLDIAREERAPLALVCELVEGIEARTGSVVRDASPYGDRWYRNWLAGVAEDRGKPAVVPDWSGGGPAGGAVPGSTDPAGAAMPASAGRLAGATVRPT